MSSPKKTSPTATPPPTKSALRPFARRKSSDLASIIADLRQKTEDLQTQLDRKEQDTRAANEKARRVEEREARLKELARRFWKDEWNGMKDFVGLFNNSDMKRHMEEIERRLLSEYRDLFGEEGAVGNAEGR